MYKDGTHTMLKKSDLKQKLIDLNLCINNNYLNLYINIIWNARNNVKQKFKTERHHIIPKYYFKLEKLTCDNSKDNIVNLFYLDHMKAHIYLCLCSTDSFLKYASCAAHRTITGHQGFFKHVDEINNVIDLETVAKYKEVWRKEVSKRSSTYKNNLGRIAVHKPNTPGHKLIKKESLETFLKEGWVVGTTFKQSVESKEKNRQAHLGKKVSEETLDKIKATKEKNKAAGKIYNLNKSAEQKERLSKAVTEYFKTHQQINTGKIAIHNKETNKDLYVNKEDLDKYLKNGYEKGLAKTAARDKAKRKVICIETNEIYESATYVANMLNVVDMSVTCKNFKTKGKYNVAKKLHWAYLNDWLELGEEERKKYKEHIKAKIKDIGY